MSGQRRSLSKKMGPNSASVTVEDMNDHWIIQAVHWDGAPVPCIAETTFPTAENAFEAGMKIARGMCVADSEGRADHSTSLK